MDARTVRVRDWGAEAFVGGLAIPSFATKHLFAALFAEPCPLPGAHKSGAY